MAGKGDKRRPGEGYGDGWDRIWGRHKRKTVTYIECPECGYVQTETDDLMKECSQGWICPACEMCSRVYTNSKGDIWKVELGYHREVSVDIET